MFFVGFSRRLKGMGGLRFGVVHRVSGWELLFIYIGIAFFYMIWYTLIFCGWSIYYMMYGLYLVYKYLFIGIYKAIKYLVKFIKGKIEERKKH